MMEEEDAPSSQVGPAPRELNLVRIWSSRILLFSSSILVYGCVQVVFSLLLLLEFAPEMEILLRISGGLMNVLSGMAGVLAAVKHSIYWSRMYLMLLCVGLLLYLGRTFFEPQTAFLVHALVGIIAHFSCCIICISFARTYHTVLHADVAIRSYWQNNPSNDIMPSFIQSVYQQQGFPGLQFFCPRPRSSAPNPSSDTTSLLNMSPGQSLSVAQMLASLHSPTPEIRAYLSNLQIAADASRVDNDSESMPPGSSIPAPRAEPLQAPPNLVMVVQPSADGNGRATSNLVMATQVTAPQTMLPPLSSLSVSSAESTTPMTSTTTTAVPPPPSCNKSVHPSNPPSGASRQNVVVPYEVRLQTAERLSRQFGCDRTIVWNTLVQYQFDSALAAEALINRLSPESPIVAQHPATTAPDP